jgi:beta-1,4-mannosyl-glycoprotein beta-1,4-N-acetylglucosaminyltransferase
MNNMNSRNIPNGGWHLSYFGDVLFIQNKLREFSHVEYSGDDYTDENFIQNKINNASSLFDRNDESGMTKQSIKDDKYPPLYYKTFLSKYVSY